MKRRIFNLSQFGALICLLLVIAQANARSSEEKRKTIEKSYQVSSSTDLYFSNTFGKMHIDTWDKNQVDVRIEIIVTSSSESRAEDFLDRITIDIDDSDPRSDLSFITDINGKNTGRNTSFEVNYRVSIPRKNPVSIKNSFGDVYLGPLSGEVEIDVQYGNLNTEPLTGESEIKLAFGSGFSEIEEMTRGELRLSYSKLNIEKMENVEVNSQFSTLEIETAGSIELTGKYGEIEIEQVDDLEANVNFSGFSVEKLNRSIELDIDYGGNIFIGLAGTVQSVEIESSFGPLVVELPTGLNANIEVNVSFSDLSYDEGRIRFNKIFKDHTSSRYEDGRIGSGSGAVIDISSKYGSVKIK